MTKETSGQYVTVPAEPTEEMIVSGMEADVLGRPSVDDSGHVLSIYAAMLAASPPTDELRELERGLAENRARQGAWCWSAWFDLQKYQPLPPEIRYFELRGLLERHPTDENLVRVKE